MSKSTLLRGSVGGEILENLSLDVPASVLGSGDAQSARLSNNEGMLSHLDDGKLRRARKVILLFGELFLFATADAIEWETPRSSTTTALATSGVDSIRWAKKEFKA